MVVISRTPVDEVDLKLAHWRAKDSLAYTASKCRWQAQDQIQFDLIHTGIFEEGRIGAIYGSLDFTLSTERRRLF